MESLEKYQLPIINAPERVLRVIAAGVQAGQFDGVATAPELLAGTQPPPDGVVRDEAGRVRVTCTTDMPGVTPAMIDWWFGWHLPASARYRLWHPQAHMRARVREDRSHLNNDRARYIGNVSLVDEYIGNTLKKLSIAFFPPGQLGFEAQDARQSTAVCARTSDRLLGGEGGSLVHYVVATEDGAQMRSAFWLGEIRHQWCPVDALLRRLLNTRTMRRVLVPDRFALDLLQHCAEEMNHLARFLPELYRDVTGR